jgi:glycosyltransferase involved in cell wall biosynthesis
MRILISTPYLGGAGGIERNVASTIRSLGGRHEIDVCATRHHLENGYDVKPVRGRVLPRRRWHAPSKSRRLVSVVWPAVRAVRRYRVARYDAYIYYRWGEDVQDQFRTGVRFVVPCGEDVRSLEHRFDHVLLQAPGNLGWVNDPTKAILLPPPLDVPASRAEPVPGAPDEFFLTIFNTNHARKGFDDLCAVAARSPIPVVWCRSTQFARPYIPSELDRLVVLDDLSQAQFRNLYGRCRAYISFDQTFGFGWSLADALQYGAPTLSRHDGVLTVPGLDVRGARTFDSIDELLELVQGDDFERVERDLDAVSPHRFVQRFEALVNGSRPGA